MKNKHSLDPYPIPKDKTPMFINEQHMAEIYDFEFKKDGSVPDDDDNIRVYVPLDLNKRLILDRLTRVINHYGEANEENELFFQADVLKIVSQIEIYDQIWYIRHMPDEGEHSSDDYSCAGKPRVRQDGNLLSGTRKPPVCEFTRVSFYLSHILHALIYPCLDQCF